MKYLVCWKRFIIEHNLWMLDAVYTRGESLQDWLRGVWTC